MQQPRTIQLGGELSGRSILGGTRNKVEWVGMISCLAVLGLVEVAFSSSLIVTGVVVVLALLTVFLWTPTPLTRYVSPVGMFASKLRYHWHKRRSLTSFEGAVLDDNDEVCVQLPCGVGQMRYFEVELPSRLGIGQKILVQVNRDHKRTVMSAVFEVRSGRPSALGGDESLLQHWNWSRFQESMARSGSLVRYLQQVSRNVPYDPADHINFLLENMPDSPNEMLTASYAELLDRIESETEQNRTWLVIGMPRSSVFKNAVDRAMAADLESAVSEKYQRALERVIADELSRVVQRANQAGMKLRPLDEKRYAAVMRALQDPDELLDDLEDADRVRMWLPWDGSESPEYLRITGGKRNWYARTAIVKRDAIAAGEIPINFLMPLVMGINSSVIRTISTHITLVPSAIARGEASRDLTTDKATVAGNRHVTTDGSDTVQLSAAQQRSADLTPGSGHHGADWAISLTIQAPSADELESAVNLVEEAAADASISILDWQDYCHHLTFPTTLPLAAGVARRKMTM